MRKSYIAITLLLLAACTQPDQQPNEEPDAAVDENACETGPAAACTALLAQHETRCAQSDFKSCNALAIAHFEGAFAPENKDKAMELTQRACTGGYKEACWNASVFAGLYAQGAGVPIDSAKATALNKTACAGGVKSACDWLSETNRR